MSQTKTQHTPLPWVQEGIDILGGMAASCHVAAVIQRGEDERAVALANATCIVQAVNAHDALVVALNTALTELRAIQARDGAPQHISWDRGRPLQSDACSQEWWATVVDRCEAALALAEK